MSSARNFISSMLLLALMLPSCVRGTSNQAADNRSPGSKKGSEAPDAIPGYLIDKIGIEAFGYTSTAGHFTGVLAAPFARVENGGAAVISLDRSALDIPHVIAFYSPRPGQTCSEFIQHLTDTNGGTEESHRQSRFFSFANEATLSGDGMALTLYYNASDEALDCTFLLVADALPQDAGYRPRYSRLAFLVMGDVSTDNQEDTSTRFVTNEHGQWQAEVVEADTPLAPGIKNLPFKYDASSERFVTFTASKKLYERRADTWGPGITADLRWGTSPALVNDLAAWSDGEEQVLMLEEHPTEMPNQSVLTKQGADSDLERRDNLPLGAAGRGTSLHADGLMATITDTPTRVARIVDLKKLYSGQEYQRNSQSLSTCSSVSQPSIVAQVLTAEEGYFAFLCGTTPTLLKMVALNENRLISIPTHFDNTGSLVSTTPAALQVDARGYVYLLYQIEDDIQYWLVEVSPEDEIRGQLIQVTGLRDEERFLNGHVLAAVLDGAGGLHIFQYTEWPGLMGSQLRYGRYQINTTTFSESIENLPMTLLGPPLGPARFSRPILY